MEKVLGKQIVKKNKKKCIKNIYVFNENICVDI